MKDYPIEIQNLIKEVYEDTKIRMKSSNSKKDFNEHIDVNSTFIWSATPQGNEFWSLIYIGNYDAAKKFDCYPEPTSTIINNFKIF